MENYAYVVILIGCYPSRNHPDFHHEYPKELLELLGDHCLVILIDPLYKKYPHKLPSTAQPIDATTCKMGSHTFKIFPGLAEEYDLTGYPENTTLLYDFTGAANVYDILKMCRLSTNFIYRYYIHFDAHQSSSCMVRVQDLLPTTDFRSIFTYITQGTGFSSLRKEEVQSIVLPIAREYSYWLRREHMFRTSQDEFYGRETYQSMLQTPLPPVTEYYTWILSLMDPGESTLARIELFFQRIRPFFECEIVIRDALSEKICDLARALSTVIPKY